MKGYQDRPSGRGDTGFVPEDRMTRTTVEDSQLWQLIQSIQEQEVAASVLQGLLWKEDVPLGSERRVEKAGLLFDVITSHANDMNFLY